MQMTAYGQAAALSLSAPEIDFGTQYVGGLRLAALSVSLQQFHHCHPNMRASPCPPRLRSPSPTHAPVCSNRSASANFNSHTSLPTHPPQIPARYPSTKGLPRWSQADRLPQPAVNGASVNPNLSVSATSLNFPNAVVVTGVSSTFQTLTIQNTGASAFALSLVLTGDFTDTTSCGSALAGGASCSVVFTFAPSQPGTREGLLAVTAGAGTTPVYVTLSGVGTSILSPANNGTLNFGGVIAGQPTVQWIKVTQPFTKLSIIIASTTLGSPFSAILVEDIGYGHGQPSSDAFAASVSGTASTAGLACDLRPSQRTWKQARSHSPPHPAAIPYVLGLNWHRTWLTGLLLSPVAQDFGPVPVNSRSGTALFTLTNLVAGGGPIPMATPAVTGDFALLGNTSGGASCGGSLAYPASCFIEVSFVPSTTGPHTGTLTVQAGSTTTTAALTGYGSPDPGLSLIPQRSPSTMSRAAPRHLRRLL